VTVQHPDRPDRKPLKPLKPFPKGAFLVSASPALATPPIAPPPEVQAVEQKIAEEAKPPTWTWVYFFRDGGVTRLTESKPDSILYEQAYLVMVSVPARHNQAPYVEVVKSQYGRSSIILTANVPAQSSNGGNE
jgi:hypothetical protein